MSDHKFLPNLKPRGKNLIVEAYKAEYTGVIALPTPAKEDVTLSRVLAVGAEVVGVTVGDVLTFEQGRKGVIDGRTVYFIHENGIFAVYPKEHLPASLKAQPARPLGEVVPSI